MNHTPLRTSIIPSLCALAFACMFASQPVVGQQVFEWNAFPRAGGHEAFSTSYDPIRSRIVLFGGCANLAEKNRQSMRGETWEWDGRGWSFKPSAHSPSPRAYAGMAWDPIRNTTILFGGLESYDGTTLRTFGDMWEWDGTDWKQINLSFSPSSRMGHGMCTDRRRGRVVLYGGSDRYGILSPIPMSDTWEWDGIQWRLILGSSAPGARHVPAMAEDVIGGYVMLYGGIIGAGYGGGTADTWSWNGAQWTLQATQSLPGQYVNAGYMVTDPSTLRPFILGTRESASTNGYRDAMWRWTGANWIDITVDSLPRFCDITNLCSDDTRGTIVAPFGMWRAPVANGTQRLWSTHVYHDRQWIEKGTGLLPYFKAAIWDPSSGSMLLIAVPVVASYGTPVETWTWKDGIGLARINTGIGNPSFAAEMSLGWDPAHGTIVFAGSDTWSFSQNKWTRIAANAPQGTWNGSNSMVFDYNRNRLVMPDMVGKRFYEFDGTAWSSRTIPWPVRTMINSAFAFDRVRSRLVVFGGLLNGVSYNDVWECDGMTWQQVRAPVVPSPRFGHLMAYDPRLQEVVMMGGDNGQYTKFSDSWKWNGTRWEQLTTPRLPTDVVPCGMSYDVARQTLMCVYPYSNNGAIAIAEPTIVYGLRSDNLRVSPQLASMSQPVKFTVNMPHQAGEVALLALSLSQWPGIPLVARAWGMEELAVAPDALCMATLQAGLLVPLDGNGRGNWSMVLPSATEIMGWKIFSAAAVANPSVGWKEVSAGVQFEIVK